MHLLKDKALQFIVSNLKLSLQFYPTGLRAGINNNNVIKVYYIFEKSN